jgi:hypothetical protein
MGGHVACITEEKLGKGFDKKPEGNRPFSKPKSRWNNIRINLQ